MDLMDNDSAKPGRLPKPEADKPANKIVPRSLLAEDIIRTRAEEPEHPPASAPRPEPKAAPSALGNSNPGARFTANPFSGINPATAALIAARAQQLAEAIESSCPNGRERALALTHLETSFLFALRAAS